MRPALESLRIFAECVRCGSFAAAAESLFLTPAAVSLRIRTLEKELGKALFVRRGPRVEPTNAALALAARIDRAIGDIDSALGEFHRAGPLIRITAPPSFASRWLAPRLARYQAEHPDVAIELDVSMDIRPKDAFDVAIRTGTGSWPGFDARALFPVDLTPMLSPALAGRRNFAQASDLAERVLLPHPAWPRWLQEAGRANDVPFRYSTIEYPNHELNADAAMAGEGVALLPRSLFEASLEDRKLLAPFDHVLADDWHFALLHDGETRREATAFVDWLSAEAERHRGR
ncbi:LysR family transcriptional regulator [Luteimonas gilva]|uniref:LysR family transcriptional regulator n=1 Tax=Luteimonas gilva TaxID=2572684 RepID=A0A4U5JU00_9GAMM|nr:LysR substrate-binding domain-containing protein [Luteimonas gilva]TKR33314.1 LysR family transcriptional regulator [Luteimonas gilva]